MRSNSIETYKKQIIPSSNINKTNINNNSYYDKINYAPNHLIINNNYKYYGLLKDTKSNINIVRNKTSDNSIKIPYSRNLNTNNSKKISSDITYRKYSKSNNKIVNINNHNNSNSKSNITSINKYNNQNILNSKNSFNNYNCLKKIINKHKRFVSNISMNYISKNNTTVKKTNNYSFDNKISLYNKNNNISYSSKLIEDKKNSIYKNYKYKLLIKNNIRDTSSNPNMTSDNNELSSLECNRYDKNLIHINKYNINNLTYKNRNQSIINIYNTSYTKKNNYKNTINNKSLGLEVKKNTMINNNKNNNNNNNKCKYKKINIVKQIGRYSNNYNLIKNKIKSLKKINTYNSFINNSSNSKSLLTKEKSNKILNVIDANNYNLDNVITNNNINDLNQIKDSINKSINCVITNDDLNKYKKNKNIYNKFTKLKSDVINSKKSEENAINYDVYKDCSSYLKEDKIINKADNCIKKNIFNSTAAINININNYNKNYNSPFNINIKEEDKCYYKTKNSALINKLKSSFIIGNNEGNINFNKIDCPEQQHYVNVAIVRRNRELAKNFENYNNDFNLLSI